MKRRSPQYAKVLEEALRLDPEERRALAEELLDSLDEAGRETVLRRVEELRSGKVLAIPLEEAAAAVRAELDSKRATRALEKVWENESDAAYDDL